MIERSSNASVVLECLLVAGLFALAGCQTSSSAEHADDRADASDRAASASPSPEELASELPEGASPFEGVVTAAQPSQEQLESLGGHFGTVVNLRPHDEEGAWDEGELVDASGATYVHVPIAGPKDLTRDNVERLHEVLRKSERLTLVHCSSSNRVGALFSLRAHWIQGKTVGEALEVGRKAGLTRLEEAVRDRMSEEER